ncbi:MAG: xanthine dehydrogenase family protein molybdopterin-binding subunit [Candidatus Tectomicrobia bacterium]|nr:xanthine dehydrogenase family protein molybdopterin-binding subunit [Candidatus Tectomicrobia bacterium]
MGANAAYRVIGASLPRPDAAAKSTGEAVFGVDVKLPRMAVGKLLTSPLPHARIRHLDTERARRLRGVYAVVTGADAPPRRFGFIKDQPVLERHKVRCVGDPMAAVAARDEETAEEALELIRVELEELPAVFEAEAALREGAPIIHEELPSYGAVWKVQRWGNVSVHSTIAFGDLERGFAQADVCYEDDFTTQKLHQGYLEPHVVVARVEAGGRVSLWTTTQGAFNVRAQVAELFDLALSQVRVLSPYTGGSFGGKLHPTLEPLAVLLAQASRRPVRLMLTPDEELTQARPRPSSHIRLKTGLRRDGAILARQATLTFDTGAYSGATGPTANTVGARSALGPYQVPNLRVETFSVYTNNRNCGSYRASGASHATFASESQLDLIARRLGIDPLELRLRNGVVNGVPSPTGSTYTGIDLGAMLRTAAERIRWRAPRAPYEGVGIACAEWGSAGRGSAAVVKLNEDGSVGVLSGAIDLGTGSETIFAQIAAEELGIDPRRVVVSWKDTDAAPFDAGSVGTRVTYNMGDAVRRAAIDCREKARALAARLLEADLEDVLYEDGRAYVRGAAQQAKTLAELSAAAHNRPGGGPLVGAGGLVSPAVPFDRQRTSGLMWGSQAAVSIAAQAARVRVDPETGAVAVLEVVAAHDVGKAINPNATEGQIEGGISQAVGYACTEQLVYERGVLQNGGWHEYKVLTSLDMPRVQPILVEGFLSDGPYGVKGIAEAAVIPTAPAVVNAVADAIGVHLRDLPLTPERVLRALRETRRAEPPG